MRNSGKRDVSQFVSSTINFRVLNKVNRVNSLSLARRRWDFHSVQDDSMKQYGSGCVAPRVQINSP